MTEAETYLAKRKNAKRIRPQSHEVKPPEIEHGIPPPKETRGGARNFSHFYPFEEMKVGDSFWVGGETMCTRGAVTDFAKRSGWKFVCRAQTKDGKPNAGQGGGRGTRVWRVK